MPSEPPGHWLDSAPTAAERARRQVALDHLAVVRPDGTRVIDGPAVLDLIRRWDKAFEWKPGRDRGLLVYNRRGRLVEKSEAVRKLLVP